MNEFSVTQSALDRLEANLKEYVALLVEANDRRYEQRFKDSQTAVDAALNAARTAVDAALSAAKEAVHKAEMASEKRFEGVNEFRETLSDQQRTLMPRAEADLRMGTIEKDVAELKRTKSAIEGRATGAKESWVLILGVVALVGGLLAIAFRFANP